MPSSTAIAGAALAGVAGAFVTKQLDSQYFFVKDVERLSKLSLMALQIERNVRRRWTAADMLEEAARKYQDKPAVIFESRQYSFRQWNQHANRVARWAQSQGIGRGDVVAVYMENRPEYMFTWTGLAKIGAVAALLNNNLKQGPLIHCVDAASCKHIIFDSEGAERIAAIKEALADRGIKMYAFLGDKCQAPAWASSVNEPWALAPGFDLPRSVRSGVTFEDPCMYIYTSGTTGLPKAAVIKHAKFFGAGAAFSINFGLTSADRIYNSGLPLYHSAGNNIGGGVVLYTGATLVLRRKFSATNFWKDAGTYGCTVVQYIGELCRYLLATPQTAADKAHKVRIAIGNGLRPDIWGEFQTRFAVPEVGEFYGATEGNVALFNLCREERARGAIGHMGLLMRQLGLCRVLRYDPDKEDIVRDPVTGLCIEADYGEPGEAIGKIVQGRAAGGYDGYKGNKEATQKKILRDVFVKGDEYFRTGDLLSLDRAGYYYFIDRIGDTFRWKGENVATTEVASVVSKCPGVLEANVYGVKLPGRDGRACMVAIVENVEGALDLEKFAQVAVEQLPAYAVPLFLRKLPRMEVTGTFKHTKVALRKQGADATLISDPLYFFDANAKAYVPMDIKLWNDVITRSRL